MVTSGVEGACASTLRAFARLPRLRLYRGAPLSTARTRRRRPPPTIARRDEERRKSSRRDAPRPSSCYEPSGSHSAALIVSEEVNPRSRKTGRYSLRRYSVAPRASAYIRSVSVATRRVESFVGILARSRERGPR